MGKKRPSEDKDQRASPKGTLNMGADAHTHASDHRRGQRHASPPEREEPVIRFFVPPDQHWIIAKSKELGISQSQISKRPPYGPRKAFDGLTSRPRGFLSITGDGHCGFRAISVMLTGTEEHFRIIRKRVAKFVAESASQNWLRPHLPFPFDAASYVQRISCASGPALPKNYCSDVELMAAAVLFRMNILCYKADRSAWQFYAYNKIFEQEQDVPTLLVNFEYEHFTVVTDVEPLPSGTAKEMSVYKERISARDSGKKTEGDGGPERQADTEQSDRATESRENHLVCCDLCGESFDKQVDYVDHLVTQHGHQSSRTTQEFSNENALEKWLRNLRLNQATKFIKTSSEQNGGNCTEYYYCSHCNGDEGPIQQTLAAAKRAKRSSGRCTAYLEVTRCNSGAIHVTGELKHFGHEPYVAAQPLTAQQEKRVTVLLECNKTTEDILQFFKKDEDPRMQDLTTEDVNSVRSKGNPRSIYQLDDSDLKRVTAFMDEKNAVPGEPIFFNFCLPTFPNLTGFSLGIMTSLQKQLFWKHAYKGICVDVTHNISKYGLELTSVLVYDDKAVGMPVCFYLSKIEDEKAVTSLFFYLKQQYGNRQDFAMVMTGCSLIYSNAFSNVFPQHACATKHVFCSWHVLHEWSEAAHRMLKKNIALEKTVIDAMHGLMRALDKETFSRKLKAFLNIISDPAAKDFQSYFKNGWLNSDVYGKWSPPVRRDLIPKNITPIEKRDRTFEKNFLHGSQNKCLDECVRNILHGSERMNAGKCVEETDEHSKDDQEQQMNKSHMEAVTQYPDHAIEEKVIYSAGGRGIFYARSNSVESQWYEVIYQGKSGCKNGLHCYYCGCCWNEFVCDCASASVSSVPCKHMHAVKIYLLLHPEKIQLPEMVETQKQFENESSSETAVCNNSFDKNAEIDRILCVMEQLRTEDVSKKDLENIRFKAEALLSKRSGKTGELAQRKKTSRQEMVGKGFPERQQ